MARLIYSDTEGRKAIALGPMNRIGRHPNSTIQLLDGIVSKDHCHLESRGAVWVIRDVGSSNGTFVGSEKLVGEYTLRHGDVIRLGNTTLAFDDQITQVPVPTPPISAGAIQHSNPMPSPTDGAGHWNTATKPVIPAMQPAQLVNVGQSTYAIGNQVAAQSKDFLPFDEAVQTQTLRLDYERLRITWELLREIGLERDLDKLLAKILLALFRFVAADRGVILIKEPDGSLTPRAHRRRDGAEVPINISSTILNHVIKERAGVMSHDASSDFGVSQGKSMFLNKITSAIVVPLLHDKDVVGALWLDSEKMGAFKAKDLELITAVGNQVAMLVSNTVLALKVEQEIVTRKRFSRLLSPNVAEQVVSGQLDIKKGGMTIPEATVFNSDLRGFTRMSEGTTAEEMVDLLNEYFELMVEVIFKHEGTLDKFMGDGIMAFWGAPAYHQDDAIRSVRCALDQMDVLAELNARRIALGKVPLSAGIGIHTGSLVSGYVGSSKALSYTVIGDTVNISARLCGIAEGGQILVSEATAGKLGADFRIVPLKDAVLKGKEKPLPVFTVTRA